MTSGAIMACLAVFTIRGSTLKLEGDRVFPSTDIVPVARSRSRLLMGRVAVAVRSGRKNISVLRRCRAKAGCSFNLQLSNVKSPSLLSAHIAATFVRLERAKSLISRGYSTSAAMISFLA